MNLINRVFAVLALLILAFGGAFALIFPSWTLSLMHAFADAGHNLMGETSWILRQIIRTVVAVLFLAIMGALMWLELRQPNQKTVEVVSASGGKVRVATTDIQNRLVREVEAMNGVISAKVNVSARKKGIYTETDAVIMPDIDGATKGDEIAQTVRSVAESSLGVKLLAKPQVNVKIGKVKGSKLKEITNAPASTSTAITPLSSAEATSLSTYSSDIKSETPM